MVLEQRRLTMQAGIAVVLAAVVLSLTGCGNFFVYPGSLTGGSGSTGGDYAYVANSSSASTSLDAFSLSSGTLSVVTGAPFPLGITPSAMAVNPSDSLLYIASSNTSISNPGLIYAYTIGSGGVLAIANNGNAVAGGLTSSLNPVSMAISPDGQWLFVLDGTGYLNEYQINGTTGTLNTAGAVNFVIPAPTAQVQVAVAPTGQFVVCADGATGDIVYPFTTSTGAFGANFYTISPGNNAQADSAVTLDSNNYLYVGRTGLLVMYNLNSSTPGVPVASATVGSAPRGVTLDRTGSYVYVANQINSLIYAFSIANSNSAITLTSLTGSPYSAATDVTALAPDNSGKYFLDLGYNATNGIQLLSLASGVPSATGSVTGSGTTTTVPAVIALTH